MGDVTVVCGEKAPETERFAARELASCLQRATTLDWAAAFRAHARFRLALGIQQADDLLVWVTS